MRHVLINTAVAQNIKLLGEAITGTAAFAAFIVVFAFAYGGLG